MPHQGVFGPTGQPINATERDWLNLCDHKVMAPSFALPAWSRAYRRQRPPAKVVVTKRGPNRATLREMRYMGKRRAG